MFAQNMHQKRFFQAPNAKISPALCPSPRSVASLPRMQFSSEVRSLGFSKPPPPPEKFLVTGLEQNLPTDVKIQL